jgi:hypothetical protein
MKLWIVPVAQNTVRYIILDVLTKNALDVVEESWGVIVMVL